jgi:outer membrane protein OmpA-like peptidoglycan-associated protein
VVCPSCGYDNVTINESAPFCGGCGKTLHAAPVPPKVLSPPATPTPPISADSKPGAVSKRCPSCGHENANKNSPFCGGCGKPLGIAPPLGNQSPPIAAHIPKAESNEARKSSKLMVGIAALVVCLAIVGGGLAVLHRSGVLTSAKSTSGNSAKASSSSGPNAPASSAPGTPNSPSGSPPTGQTPEASTANVVQATPSASIPPGTNIAALNFGGEVESVTGSYGPGHTGRFLIDGLPEPTWRPEGEDPVHPTEPAFNHVKFPQEIVLSFYKRDAALVSAVVLRFPKNVSSRPKEIEVWTSMSSPTDNFSPVVKATLDLSTPSETISFSPVQTRYLKLRLLSSTGPDGLEIGEIEVIEGSAPGYVPLIARYPEIERWRSSVRYAAQKGIDWLEPASMDWQNGQQCFGCHVQAQTLMGLSVAQRNHYVVSPSCVRDLVAFMRTKQADDGTEKDEGAGKTITPTQFAAMGYAYFDDVSGVKSNPSLLKHVDWLTKQLEPTGELIPDYEEPPIIQGSLMTTGNSLTALMQAFAETGDTRYQQTADHSLSFIASAAPRTTQDKVFKVLALSRFGTPEQRQLVAPLLRQLQSEQNRDGGWGEKVDMHGSNAFATGQVLYSFQEAGVSIDSPEFTRGVHYLLKTQTENGAWPDDNTQSSRPSEFAATMWAVIGLAGVVEPPPAESLKAELDKNGRVALYINFDFNKATLRPDAKPIIAQVLKLLQDNPDLKLSINGHTDNVGLHDYNVKLSQMRAATVVSSLVAAHIAPDRLSSGGFGPDQPIDDNSTEKGRAKNRRVELVKM